MNQLQRCVHNLIAPPTGLHDQIMTLILYRQRLNPRAGAFTPRELRALYVDLDLQPPTEVEIRDYLADAQHCYRTAQADHFMVRDRLPNVWQGGLGGCFRLGLSGVIREARQVMGGFFHRLWGEYSVWIVVVVAALLFAIGFLADVDGALSVFDRLRQ